VQLLKAACFATRTIIGKLPIKARGLFGNLLDASLAGMSTQKGGVFVNICI
jgi:hypothetical protein